MSGSVTSLNRRSREARFTPGSFTRSSLDHPGTVFISCTAALFGFFSAPPMHEECHGDLIVGNKKARALSPGPVAIPPFCQFTATF